MKKIELERVEHTDFGLGAIGTGGLNLFVHEGNERYCGKELVLLPYQACLEYRHPPRDENEGKEETFRYQKGLVYLYVKGKETKKLSCIIPKRQERYYMAKREIVLHVGDRYTIEQNIKHRLQIGATGAVITGFSSSSDDPGDNFTNPAICC